MPVRLRRVSILTLWPVLLIYGLCRGSITPAAEGPASGSRHQVRVFDTPSDGGE